jgi:hypothetical protein
MYAIHSIAIGFIGVTTFAAYASANNWKSNSFTSLKKIPLLLIIISLSIRAVADFVIAQPFYSYSSLWYAYSSSLRMLTYFFGLSGWLIIATMLVFLS